MPFGGLATTTFPIESRLFVALGLTPCSAHGVLSDSHFLVDAAAAVDAVFKAMPEFNRRQGETEPAQSPSRSRDPLYLRLYFQQHLTELVRLFGYRDVPLDEARELLKPLNETYGLDTMKIAAEEIIFIDGSSDRPIARLADHVRKLAVGILGSPRKSLPTSDTATSDIARERQDRTQDVTPPGESSYTNHSQAESDTAPIPKQSAMSRVSRRRHPGTSGTASDVAPRSSEPIYEGPVRQRRKVVLIAFKKWLQETKQPFVGIETVGQDVGTLDFILQTEPVQRLVTVRYQITKRQAREMRQSHQKHGQQFEPYSVWPHEGPDGWEWIFTRIPEERCQ